MVYGDRALARVGGASAIGLGATMTNSLMVYERMNELTMAARALHTSGYFTDVKSEAQAMVKVLAGAEIGLPAFASMSGIHIVQGKPVLGANLIATLVKNDPRYNYRVKQADNEVCALIWYEGGQVVGESAFTIQEANAAGLTGKDNWRKYPSDMLFARALTRGARRFAPGIFGGAPIYTPDELGVETDEDGQIVTGEVIDVTPPTPAANGKPPAQPVEPQPAPLPDDEQVIYETSVSGFVNAAAAILETDADDVKARLHELGYERIPGDKGKRLDAYRRIKSGNAAQPALALEDTDATQAALASARGQMN
jgi:hypothetical protein